jgi:hypothetical protein
MKHIILIILLTLGVWGQEVGVPYVDTRGAVMERSAALSPDGETFYTYANNTLTHWSLNPVKVLEGVKIEDGDFSNQRQITIYTTPDSNIIIFFHVQHTLAVYDIQKNEFIAKRHLSARYTDIINKNIITADDENNILQLNISNLQSKKQIKLPQKQLTCDECGDIIDGIFKSTNEKTFTLVTGVRFVVIDSNTLEILKKVESNNKRFYFSLTKKILSGENASINIDFPDSESKLSSEDSYSLIQEPQWISRSIINDIVIHNGQDRNKSLIFQNTKTGMVLAKLYLLKNNSWIVMTPDGYFDRSEGSLKYLKKKLSSGGTFATPDGMIRTPPALDIVDEAMIQKYHKQINLKD